MITIKIILVFLLSFAIIILKNKNKEFFYQNEISLKGSTPHYTNINVETAQLSLNPQFDYDMNLNVENDIIIKDNIKINGKTFNIDTLRYIKKLPIHYEDKICLSDKDDASVECIDKYHIDMMNGRLPINILTYPDNNRKCISAHRRNFKSSWSEEPYAFSVFSEGNCKNGNKDNQFIIKREAHEHDGIQSHYHIHSIDEEDHSLDGEAPTPPDTVSLPGINRDNVVNYLDITPQLTITKAYATSEGMSAEDINILFGNDDTIEFGPTRASRVPIDKETAMSVGITEEEFEELDIDGDGYITA